MNWRTLLKNTLVTQESTISKTVIINHPPPFPISKNIHPNSHYEMLPEELSTLIEKTGSLYKADSADIDDMKNHVLNFINTEINGLQIALNGFRTLVYHFKGDIYE